MPLKRLVLVVEDNEMNRAMLTAILSEKYEVAEAENGREALDFLRGHKGEVSLVLLDIMMPVMDGFEFLEEVRKDAELSLIPVIVTTQNDSEEDEITALKRGATDFVPKPYRPEIVLRRAASLIGLRENAAMVNQLRYDRLTGLYTKEYFYQQAREQMALRPELEYSVICADISNFKLYNDIFGTASGDELLCNLADALKTLAENCGGICCRFGADIFLMLRCQEKRTEDYDIFVKAGQNAVSRVKHSPLRWGIYRVIDYTVSVEQMCDRAKLAADSIKGIYNTNYAVYDETMRSKLLREQLITESMERAIGKKQFEVYLQPKMSLKDNCLAGAEALVRWQHPEVGFLSPGEFIPLFEKNGFITQLDMFVWEQACTMLRDWKNRGLPLVPVSVNVSRADVYSADLADTLISLLERYGVEPGLLHLEITESAYTENPEQIIDTVKCLRELGFIVEMDDFGNGYSSLNMLEQMKPDILKLDMKFVQNESANPTEKGILRFIVELAHWMKMTVVAEGVENEAQLERMREIGCDYVQGYYYAKPMPRADFEKYMEK